MNKKARNELQVSLAAQLIAKLQTLSAQHETPEQQAEWIKTSSQPYTFINSSNLRGA